MAKIKMGVLGAGPRTGALLKAYAGYKDVEVTAICDRAKGMAEDVANTYKKYRDGANVKVYRDYETMMREKNFEALLVTIDPTHQIDYACDAMERGCHVMTEVPVCTKLEDCFKLVSTVEKTGMKYQLAEQTRYWNFIQNWRKMAESGVFGKILMVEGQYMHYEPTWDLFVNVKTGEHVHANNSNLDKDPNFVRSWRYNVFAHPILYLPHTLSPLLSITGGRIERVSCIGTRKGSYTMHGVEACDIESAIMYNSNDVIFNVRAGFTSPHPHQTDTYAHWYHVRGDKATAEWCRSEIDTNKFWTPEKGWEAHPEWKCEDADADEFIRNSEHGGADGYPIKYFAEAILKDETPPMDVYKAVETAAPAILAAKSAEMGGALLEVPDFRKK